MAEDRQVVPLSFNHCPAVGTDHRCAAAPATCCDLDKAVAPIAALRGFQTGPPKSTRGRSAGLSHMHEDFENRWRFQ